MLPCDTVPSPSLYHTPTLRVLAEPPACLLNWNSTSGGTAAVPGTSFARAAAWGNYALQEMGDYFLSPPMDAVDIHVQFSEGTPREEPATHPSTSVGTRGLSINVHSSQLKD